MLNGKAIQSTPTSAMPSQSSRLTGRREPRNTARVRKPTRMRVKVTPFGPITSRPSAMKRNDAPQMTPGTMSRIQSMEKLTRPRTRLSLAPGLGGQPRQAGPRVLHRRPKRRVAGGPETHEAGVGVDGLLALALALVDVAQAEQHRGPEGHDVGGAAESVLQPALGLVVLAQREERLAAEEAREVLGVG